MSHHQLAIQMVSELYKLMATHLCIVTKLMQEEFTHFVKLHAYLNRGFQKSSFTIFDPKQHRVTYHYFNYHDKLKYQDIYKDKDDHLTRLNDITEPANLIFCMDTLFKSYNYLQTLNREESKEFRVLFIRLLLEKDGQYHPYVQFIYPFTRDDNDNVWQLVIETKRLPVMNIKEFRLITYDTEAYTESHEYSRHLLNLKLKDEDKELLKKYVGDCKKKKLSEEMCRSLHTVSNYYTRINTLFQTNNINTSCQAYCLMEMHRTGNMIHDF